MAHALLTLAHAITHPGSFPSLDGLDSLPARLVASPATLTLRWRASALRASSAASAAHSFRARSAAASAAADGGRPRAAREGDLRGSAADRSHGWRRAWAGVRREASLCGRGVRRVREE